jgi:ribokinase
MRTTETLAIGSCYLDIDAEAMPFGADGVPSNIELVGGDYALAAGGSAVNFCKLLQHIGIETTFVGMVGEDAHGRVFEQLLLDAGVASALIKNNAVSTNVGVNLTSEDGEQHIMFVFGTANASLDARHVVPRLSEVIPSAKTLYLGGCFKMKGLLTAYGEIATIAKQSDTTLIVDHGRIPKHTTNDTKELVKALVLQADYYLPSHEEFCTLWEVDDIAAGLHKLQAQAAGLTVVVKDGSQGAYCIVNGNVQHIPARPVKHIVGLTGAGDSFNAGFIAAATRDIPLQKAVEFGHDVASAKISGQAIPVLQ